MREFFEEHFGKRPTGAWLAERVWEPHLPALLADAGVEYTLVDDVHFLSAGREIPELFGYYLAEERGKTVKVIPGIKELRYLLPFGSVEDTIDFLRRCADHHPGGMAAMGDDMEKFGAWPHTFHTATGMDGWNVSSAPWKRASIGWRWSRPAIWRRTRRWGARICQRLRTRR